MRLREGEGLHVSKWPFLAMLGVWALIPLILAIGWVWRFVARPGYGENQADWNLWVQRHITAVDEGFLGISPTAWLLALICGLAGALLMLFLDDEGYSPLEVLIIALNVTLVVTGVVGIIHAGMWTDRDRAIALSSATTIYVKDKDNVPPQLKFITDQNHKDAQPEDVGNGRTRYGELAVIAEGTTPTNPWEGRNSSLSGAQKWLLDKTPTGVQGVNIWKDTFTYVYGDTEAASRWSVVLDGSGRSRPAYGVAEWRAGMAKPHVCKFDDADGKGNYKFTRAFAGTKINSLRNVIGREQPDRFFEDQDVSGYCDENDRPVITISMLQNRGAGDVTVAEPGCFMLIKGSPSGFPDIECKEHVGPGEYPVPVYPLSVLQQQRWSIDFAAGVSNQENGKFGFEVSTYATQAGNTGDYIMKNTRDGSMWSLTPNKNAHTEGQDYTLWQMARVDQLDTGTFNPMQAYAQEEGKTANPAVLSTDAYIYMGWLFKKNEWTEYLPLTFFSEGGSIQEFVPLVGTTTLRGYGIDRTGATRFYIDMDVDRQADPVITIVNIADSKPVIRVKVPSEVRELNGGKPLEPSVTLLCDGKNVAVASPQDVQKCAQAYITRLGELAGANK